MDVATLARLEHENMIETMSTGVANAPGSLVRRRDGVVLLASGLPIRFFNQVSIESADAGADGLATAVAAIRDLGQPFEVHLRRGTDDRFRPLMAGLGLVLPAEAGPLPGMALHPIPPGVRRTPDGHEIRRVDDQAGMDDHLRAGAVGFGIPKEMLRAIVAPDTWLRPGNAVYVGYTNGAPVTTGLGVRTGRTIGIYNIATIESARRRGLGAAITERVAADGYAAGCDVAILQASPMGHSVYERLGYRTVVEYDAWIEPEPATQR
ncbi:MAG TPA: GNAT family N-acetyltransferase [Patescibacteria group bacterium]|nr:GNAT family N-acetyltransferase [Patescibacteria group bacterium]